MSLDEVIEILQWRNAGLIVSGGGLRYTALSRSRRMIQSAPVSPNTAPS